MPFEDPRCLGCRRCCYSTEMILLPSDMDRIERFTGMDRKSFAVFDGFFHRLRNVGGRCVFLRSWGCSVYPVKPLGCSIYPLIFDELEGVTIDGGCPLANEFLRRRSEVIEAIELLRTFLRELEKSYGYRVDWKLFEKSAEKLLRRSGR